MAMSGGVVKMNEKALEDGRGSEDKMSAYTDVLLSVWT